MDKIRIGNDLIVNWNITRIGKPEDLESKKLKLFLRTGFDKIRKPGCVLEFDGRRNIEHTSERL